MATEYAEVDGCKCAQETAKALLIVVDGKQHWIPKSQIGPDSEVFKVNDEGTLSLAEWLAVEKGLA
jgi:hypothetical protein